MEKNEKNNIFYVTGILTSAFYGCKTFGNKKSAEMTHLTIKTDIEKLKEISEEKSVKEIYKNSSMKPKWVSNPEGTEGYINFHTKYSIPVMVNGRIYDSDTILIDKDVEFANSIIGSRVKLQFVVKEGGVYPKAFKILELGEEYNPFAAFDEDDEFDEDDI